MLRDFLKKAKEAEHYELFLVNVKCKYEYLQDIKFAIVSMSVKLIEH